MGCGKVLKMTNTNDMCVNVGTRLTGRGGSVPWGSLAQTWVSNK